ncbi:MAG: hypothetical protein UE295_06515 [Acutalibacteraceae bacterium]|nr:hypothetical protein [Acutalibacteraceae bacterium]
MADRRKDYSGIKFGKLTAICFSHIRNNKTYWKFRCECGKEKTARIDSVKEGKIKNCGCDKKIYKKHGMTNTRLVKILYSMRERCNNPNCRCYRYYGGKGINICEEWLGKNGAENFIKWALENGYSNNLTIDRKDNDKGYSPDNCRWVDRTVQSANRKNNLGIDIFQGRIYRLRVKNKGKTMTKYSHNKDELIKYRKKYIEENGLLHYNPKDI